MTTIAWHALSRKETFLRLKTKETGLSAEEATKRLVHYGRNTLPKKKATSAFRLLLEQFMNPLIAVLLVAALVTAFLREWADTTVIAVAVALNVIIGFVQEYRAEHALVALLKIISEHATVLRDGRRMHIAREDIVPGDILLLASGDKIPADCRVIAARDLEMDEALLTGESLPQPKTIGSLKDGLRLGERTNIAYAGSVVTRGAGTAVTVATGIKTEVGKIAAHLHDGGEGPTPLQQKLASFSRWISLVVLVLALVVFVVGILADHSPQEMFTIAVALAVAAIPEGLVVGATAILAIGMHRLIREHALVRRLLAAETLGSTTVICADKTGTLTEGDMRLIHIATFDDDVDCLKKTTPTLENLPWIMTVALSTNESTIEQKDGEVRAFGSPTERGITLGAYALGFQKQSLFEGRQYIDTLPFHSERKFAAALFVDKGRRIVSVIGAPDRILPRVTAVRRGTRTQAASPLVQKALEKKIRSFADRGGRIIALASRTVPKRVQRLRDTDEHLSQLTFEALLVLQDPLRKGTRDMIERAASAGVATIMITGDHRATATAIGRDLGLPTEPKNILEGSDLQELSSKELEDRIQDIRIYARMVPSEKVRIVDAWQKRGAVVAMTGDGVNDAPALRNADIGVAVGTATDVAKEAADLVILDNNFSTIVRAIEEGRVIMENIRKVTLYLLADGFAEITLITGALVLGWPLPLLAKQILWINLVSDGLPNIALTFDPGDADIMREKPVPKQAPILDPERRVIVATVSLIAGLTNLALFFFLLHRTGDIALARSVVFASLGVNSLFYVFSCRSMRRPLWRSGLFSNPSLLVAIVLGFALQAMVFYVPVLQRLLDTVPLSLHEWGIVFAMSFAIILGIEAVKGVFFGIRRWKFSR